MSNVNPKKLLKSLLKKIPIAFTQNQKYDKQTEQILQKVCTPRSNCVDVGTHKGEVLDLFFVYAPLGSHFGFEPIPEMYQALLSKYQNTRASIYNVALSNTAGQSTFNHVVSNPAYSGLKRRQYDHKDEVDQQITVQTDCLDHIIPSDIKIDIIKIDVEGGELQVLEGAIQTIQRSKPIIIFEHGLGASEFYNSSPDKVFALLDSCSMKINTLKGYLQTESALTLEQFIQQYEQRINYYFVAY